MNDSHSGTLMPDQQLLPISSSQHLQLERVYAAADGSVKALFEDNAVVHLTSSADCFVYIAPDGSRINQLTDYCLHKYFPRLQPVLAYRNQCACDVPRFCPSFLQSLPPDTFSSLGYPILEAAWPSTVEIAFQRHVAVLHDEGAVAVHSLCGTAYAALDLSGWRFQITCQLLVSCQPGAQQYHYVEHTQQWPPHACPSRWRPVLVLLQAIADNACQGFPLSPAATSPATSPTKQQRKGCDQQPFTSPTAAAAAAAASPQVARLGGGSSSSPDLTDATHITHFLTPLPISPDLLLTLPPSTATTASSRAPVAIHYDTTTTSSSRAAPLALPWTRPGTTSSTSSSRKPWQHKQQQQRGGPPAHPQQHPPSPAAAAAAALAAARTPLAPASASARSSSGSRRGRCASPEGPTRPLSPLGRESSSAGGGGVTWGRDRSASPGGLRGTTSSSSSPHHQQQQQQQQQAASRIAAAVAASYSADPWWTSQTLGLPSDQLLVLMWTPEAVYMFDRVHGEVVAWVGPPCPSALVSQQRGAFMQHYLPGEEAPRGYVSTCPPEVITLGGVGVGQQRLAVGLLVATAFRFRNAMVAVMAAQAAAAQGEASSSGGSPLSHEAAAAGRPPRLLGAAAGALADTAAAAVLEQAAAKAAALQRVRDTAAAAGGGAAGQHLPHSSSREQLRHGSPPGSTAPSVATPGSVFDLGQTQEVVRSMLVDQDLTDPWGGWHGRPLAPEEVAEGAGLSQQVVECQEVEGAGEFMAYADGRIRVRFTDRTLLWMDARRATARLLLPDGRWARVAVDHPLGVEAYVQAAWEFAAWAFKTPEQRARELRLAALVQAELDASARMATLCEWAALTSRPATSARRRATAAAAGGGGGGGDKPSTGGGRVGGGGGGGARPYTAPGAAEAASRAAGGGGVAAAGYSSRSRPASPVAHHGGRPGSKGGEDWGSSSCGQGPAAAAAGVLPEAAAAAAGKRLTYREREVLVGQALQDTQVLLQRLLQ